MFRNYFLTAWRNLWKNSFFSVLNVLGLAIGMTAFIIIMLFVSYELEFDGFHKKNIYRLNEVQDFPGMVAPQKVALSMFPMGPVMTKEYPEILSFTRANAYQNLALTVEDKKIIFPKVLYADSNFLEFFDFQLIKGTKENALDVKNSLVLTTEAAGKLFGTTDIIGKTVTNFGNDTTVFTITGILKDLPANSHLQFDGIFPISTITGPENMNNWGGNWLTTYFEIAPQVDVARLESKFPDILKRYMDEEGQKEYTLFLQPLADIHSGSVDITHDYLNHQKFDKRYTYLFSIIAFIVLLIACINFMNLATAKSTNRSKEVGVRKTVGASRMQLGVQFVGESVMICLLALVVAVTFVYFSIPFVRDLSEREIIFPLFTNARFLLLLVAGTIFTGVIAGLYPSIYLSSFDASLVLKGAVTAGRSGVNFRNVLVVAQFTGSVFLIIATVFAVKQLRFMQDKDPGFSREQVMLIKLNEKTYPNYQLLKEKLLTDPAIQSVSASGQRLGNNLHQTGVIYHGGHGAQQMSVSQNIVDYDFLKLYKIPLVAGRDFSNDYATDNGKAYIINETLAKELLKDENQQTPASLLGKRFGFNGMDSAGTIIGIAKDFNFNSLHHKIETLCLMAQRDWGYDEVSIRLSGSSTKGTIERIGSIWKTINPAQEMDYKFLDQHLSELYKADNQVSKVVGILAALAISISCLGLFGLASYSAEKRFREIGVRKVLGATVDSVVQLLSRDFIKLVIVANLIAWPIAWLAVTRWLESFAFRIEITWHVFFAAGIASLLIALATVSFQAIKAARANPVKSLKY
jgi:putative ABC transport system permease protein